MHLATRRAGALARETVRTRDQRCGAVRRKNERNSAAMSLSAVTRPSARRRRVAGRSCKPRRSSGVRRSSDRLAARRDVRCTLVSKSGRRCTGSAFLEMDHAQSRAQGGSGEATNLHIRCHAHNQFRAGRMFGEEHVAKMSHLRWPAHLPSALARAPPQRIGPRTRPCAIRSAHPPLRLSATRGFRTRFAARLNVGKFLRIRRPQDASAAAHKSLRFGIVRWRWGRRVSLLGVGFRGRQRRICGHGSQHRHGRNCR